jgi:hypothetical protein
MAQRLKAAGCRLLCYIATTYAKKPEPKVLEELSAYSLQYPKAFEGVFFDEMRSKVAALPLYLFVFSSHLDLFSLFPFFSSSNFFLFSSEMHDARYYSSLTRQVHQGGFPIVVANPGGQVPESFFKYMPGKEEEK